MFITKMVNRYYSEIDSYDDIFNSLYPYFKNFTSEIIDKLDELKGQVKFDDVEVLTFSDFVQRYVYEGKSEDAIEVYESFEIYLSTDDYMGYIISNFIDGEEYLYEINRGEYVLNFIP